MGERASLRAGPTSRTSATCASLTAFGARTRSRAASGLHVGHRNRFAACAWEPNRRIDYILVGPPDSAGRGGVTAARLVFDEPVGDLFASDDFGVVAKLRL